MPYKICQCLSVSEQRALGNMSMPSATDATGDSGGGGDSDNGNDNGDGGGDNSDGENDGEDGSD